MRSVNVLLDTILGAWFGKAMEIPYVKDEYLALARSWEKRFQELPDVAGVVFIGVHPDPAPKGIPSSFEVYLGMSRSLSEDTGMALIEKYLEKEIQSGEFTIRVTVVTGVAGAANDGRANRDPKTTDVRC